ncbi:MAG: acylneuraminate cytidylyltransferase family protein, partial [Marinobacter sp.]|uniref:acylneuraminate cytidylyltransferase family protein n=1 Tax=Marinobacter sp. TaxID=50741 RepID=UPI00299F4A6B
LSTNDDEIIQFAQGLADERLQIHHRDDRLASSDTSTDDLVGHAAGLIPEGDILWTHVTSPFVTAVDYDQIIARYRRALEEGYDSLMTVTKLHGFLWDERGAVNYDRKVEKWPRTQTLEPIYEVNSAVFLAPVGVYAEQHDRIGGRPYMYPLERVQGFDIDWPEDFQMAEALLTAGVATV